MYRHEKILVSIPLLLLILSIFGNSLGNVVATPGTSALYVGQGYVTGDFVNETLPPINVYIYTINMTGYQFELRFNTTLLQCLSATAGNAFPPGFSSTVNWDNSQGIVSIQANGTPAPYWLSLRALSTVFNVTYATPYPQPNDMCTLEIANATLYGTGNPPQTIPYIIQNGVYSAPYEPPQLNLTLNTSSNFNGKYYLDSIVNVTGNLTGNGYPIPDALVALEIRNPHGNIVVVRTLQTSTLPVSGPIQITRLTPCDSNGNPEDSFSVGSFAYFNVTVKNVGPTNLSTLLAINVYDSVNSSAGVGYTTVSIPPGSTFYEIFQMPLNSFLTPLASGNATVYASVWSDRLENGGIPLSSEGNANFTITGTAQGKPTLTSQPPPGTYQAIQTLHSEKGAAGNYQINAAATFMGNNVTQSRQIWMTLAGDINGDGKVGLSDLGLLAKAYSSHGPNYHYQGEPASQNWNSNADINGDGMVNLTDLGILARNYGKST